MGNHTKTWQCVVSGKKTGTKKQANFLSRSCDTAKKINGACYAPIMQEGQGLNMPMKESNMQFIVKWKQSITMFNWLHEKERECNPVAEDPVLNFSYCYNKIF